jgi:hypothetical protein
LYNEIFWSFQNIEPTNENNIRVSIISPETWQKILFLRLQLKENSALPETWLGLVQTYQEIAFFHGPNLRNSYYADKIAPTFERGIVDNSDNADLHAYYADYILFDCCYYDDRLDQAQLNLVTKHAERALALDSKNELADRVFRTLKAMRPNLTFTRPATIPPTAMPAVSSTPTETFVPSITPKSSQTPIIVTVVKTKIVITTPLNTSTATKTTHTPSPTLTVTQTPEIEVQPAAKFGWEWFAYPLLLVAGFVGGIFVSKKKWV